ncbi:MAG: molybdopterin cofactor-binding domain-containing protein, partial [Draconibacterium sp.]|nr:molybdopterin cofactor-binding domain-containing protein [Draconibacterium sp.]
MQKSKTKTAKSDQQMSRRNFLKVSGGTGLFILFPPGMFGMFDQQQRGRSYPTDLNAYLKIGENNRVALFCSKIEMGQGIYTSMAQMLAEELDVSLESIDMVMGDTMLCPWDSSTTGSRSTKYYGPPLRRAGAEARTILLQLASEKLGVPTELLVVKNGVVSEKSKAANKITYGELVKGKRIERHISDVSIKAISEHTVSGKAIKRTDARQKITGQAKFTGDIQLPGMLYAKVLRPPSHGAQLKSVDVSQAERVDGAIVINKEELVAVLHENPEIAENALSLIDSSWDEEDPNFDNHSVFDYMKKAAPEEGRVYVEQGNLEEGKSISKKRIESEFYNHYVAHAPSEPYVVLADVKDDKATIWASTQAPFRVQDTAAETLNIPEENVHVKTPFLGGGFGGKKSGQQIVEAVTLSKITGRPVQLAWTRKEEFFYDAYR